MKDQRRAQRAVLRDDPYRSKGRVMAERGWLQPVVRHLMRTVLEDHPTLLSHAEKSSLMDVDYCKNVLGLKLAFPLLSNERMINGRARYWARRYGSYYVCSEWGKDDHGHNAVALQRFIERLVTSKPDQPGVTALKRHAEALAEQEMGSKIMSSPCAWRAYATTALTGAAASVTQDDIPALCHIAS